MPNELRTEVEQVKQQVEVKRALAQTGAEYVERMLARYTPQD